MDRIRQDALYSEASTLYTAELRRLVRGYEANPEHQLDLLQEIHFELWRSLASFDGRCSLRTWTFRIAHNASSSHVARRMRSPRLIDLDSESAPPPLADDRGLSAEDLLDLVRRLKLLDRQIILLYLEGEDAKAIAEVTGLSANNVATKIHRIKRLLRQQWNEGVPGHA